MVKYAQIQNLLIFVSIAGCSADLYSHVYSLQDLFLKEEGIVAILKKALTINNNKEITDYLERFKSRENEVPIGHDKVEKRNEHIEATLEKLVGNPVHVYTLIYRYYKLLPTIRKKIDPKLDEFVDEIINGEAPSLGDFDGAAMALARIQFTYRIPVSDLAKGIINGVETEARLTADELFEIAEQRVSGRVISKHGHPKDYAIAFEFAEAALEICKDGIQKAKLLVFMNQLMNEHDQYWIGHSAGPFVLPNEAFFINKIKNITEEPFVGRRLREVQAQYITPDSLSDVDGATHNVHVFQALCRGERIRYRVQDAAQICFYAIFKSAALPILKVEMLSIDPPLYVFHEVLSKTEIKSFKEYVATRLETASVQRIEAGKVGRQISVDRVQATGWLWEHEYDFLYKLSKKIETFTNLKLARPDNSRIEAYVESEAWQVGVYGPGGHYLPHYDVLQGHGVGYNDHGEYTGNRIATAMFYLSELSGGGTAFPKIGVAAKPRAGSLVLWYNLNHKGEQDILSLHGACPTALGVKWVANKWILSFAQTFKRKCPTSL